MIRTPRKYLLCVMMASTTAACDVAHDEADPDETELTGKADEASAIDFYTSGVSAARRTHATLTNGRFENCTVTSQVVTDADDREELLIKIVRNADGHVLVDTTYPYASLWTSHQGRVYDDSLSPARIDVTHWDTTSPSQRLADRLSFQIDSDGIAQSMTVTRWRSGWTTWIEMWEEDCG